MFRLFVLRRLRARPLRALLAVLAIVAGTALASLVLVVRTSMQESVEGFGERVAVPTAELRVVGPMGRGGVTPDVVRTVAGTRGVEAAVPLVQTVGSLTTVTTVSTDSTDGTDRSVVSRPVLVLGVDCRVQLLVGDLGCEDVGDLGDLDESGSTPLATGGDIGPDEVLQTHAEPVSLTGAPNLPELAGAGTGGDTPVVVLPLAAAQELFGRADNVDDVYVQPGPGVGAEELRRRLAAALGPGNSVLRAADSPPEIDRALRTAVTLFTTFAVFALATGGLLIYNATALAVAERRSELAVMGALGASPRQVGTTLLGEAAIVGGLGGVLGALGALGLAPLILDAISWLPERILGTSFEVHAEPLALLLAPVLGVVVSVAAAGSSIRAALRIDVAAELSGREQRARASTRRLLRRLAVASLVTVVGFGVLRAVGQATAEPWAAVAAGAGFVVSVVGILLAEMALAGLAVRHLGRYVRVSASGRLALGNLAGDLRLMNAMLLSLSVAMVIAFLVTSATDGIRSSVARSIRDNVSGLQVSTSVFEVAPPDDGLSPEEVQALAALPEVGAVSRFASVQLGARPEDLTAVWAYETPWLDMDVVRGAIDPARFAAGEVLISSVLAHDEDLGPGDRLAVSTLDGTKHVRVMAVVRGSGGTAATTSGRWVQVPFGLHRQLFGEQQVEQVILEPRAGVGLDELAVAVNGSFAADSALVLRGPRQLVEDAEESASSSMAPFWTMQRVMLGVAFLAVLSTLVLLGLQRRREMGTLAAVGMTPAALGGVVVAEAVAVGALTIVVGTAGAALVLRAFLAFATVVTGIDIPYQPAWGASIGWGVVGLLVAVGAAVGPSIASARRPVTATLQAE